MMKNVVLRLSLLLGAVAGGLAVASPQATYSFNKHFSDIYVGTVTIESGPSTPFWVCGSGDLSGNCLNGRWAYYEGARLTTTVSLPRCRGASRLNGWISFRWTSASGRILGHRQNFHSGSNGKTVNVEHSVRGDFGSPNGNVTVNGFSECKVF